MAKVLLIDGFGLIFRGYYALIKRPLFTAKGFPTSAIYGFWKMVFRSVREIQPDRFVIAFDSHRQTFRKEMYEAYKANREEAPEDLKTQIKYIVEMVSRLHVPHLMKEGFEADDIIAYLSKNFSEKGDDVYILSSDKDLSQLVGSKIKMACPEKGISELKIMGEPEVFEKFGVLPSQIVDYLSLLGDTSDNIPGVKGVGEKTAASLLKDWKTLEGIYGNIDKIKSESVRKKLIDGKESAFLSKKLVILRTDIDGLDMDWKHAHFTPEVVSGLAEEFQKLEFQSLIKETPVFQGVKVEKKTEGSPGLFDETVLEDSQKKESFSKDQVSYHLVLKKDEMIEIKKKIQDLKLIVIDTETTSENVIKAQLIGVSLALKEQEAYYFPVFKESPADYTLEDFFKIMKEPLEDPSIRKIGQNIKYDYQILKKYVKLDGIYFDTMLAGYLLDPDEKKYNMDYLALRYLNYQTIHFSDIVPKGKTLLDVELETVKNYSCEDADITFRLYRKFLPLLKEQKLESIFFELEMPLIEILGEMELAGIKLNLKALKELEMSLEDKIIALEKEIYELAGLSFNINSTRQVGEVLFDKMGLPVIKKTKTGYSTDESVLEELKVYPIASKILEYRKYNKLLNTYVQTLPSYLIEGRIHSSFHQTGTATGRLSSSDPNLQNIPIREEIGNEIRKAFVPADGKVLVSADYSQVELRILAHFSNDASLRDAFIHGRDIHKFTASLIFNVPEDQVSHFQRAVAKTINFGIIYGMGPFKLSHEIGVSFSEAKKFIERYFEIFPGVKAYIEQIKADARRKGYIQTLFGHKRFFKYINSQNKNMREADERTAVNSVFQGTNADIMKKVMIEIHPLLKEYSACLILQIHDELLFEVEEKEEGHFKKFIQEKMENTVKLSIPLKISISSGKSWGEIK